MGVSKGHVKVEDVKKRTESVVAALNMPIQVIFTRCDMRDDDDDDVQRLACFTCTCISEVHDDAVHVQWIDGNAIM